MPSDSGITSNRTTSFTSPVSTPPWMAAPMATTSSGFTPLCGSLPKKAFTTSWIFGMRVDPPTKITWSIWLTLSPESLRACSVGRRLRCTRSSTSCSNLERLRSMFKCFGPEASAVMNGRLMFVFCEPDSSILAFSAASFNRCMAMASLLRSTPSDFLNSSMRNWMMRPSKSSPPKCVSPLVDFTSNTPSPSSRIEMSNVPPPRSYTATVCSLSFLSKP